jgi:hypothetical protein
MSNNIELPMRYFSSDYQFQDYLQTPKYDTFIKSENDIILSGEQLTNQKVIQQLDKVFLKTIPYRGQGSGGIDRDFGLELQLLSGQKTSDKKTVSGKSELSVIDNPIIPNNMLSCLDFDNCFKDNYNDIRLGVDTRNLHLKR